MANNLQFSTPIAVPNLTKAKVGLVRVDEDNSVMEVEVTVLGPGNIKQQDNPWILRITNGAADALVADPNSDVIGRLLRKVRLGGAGVATAFTAALTGYRNAGADKRGNLMTALLGISGTVQDPAIEVGALSGTTQTILPPGTVL